MLCVIVTKAILLAYEISEIIIARRQDIDSVVLFFSMAGSE